MGVLGVSDAESTKFASAIGAPKAYRTSTRSWPTRPSSRCTWPCPNVLHFELAKRAVGGRQARAVREAAGDELARVGGAGWRRPEALEAAAGGVLLHVRFYPLTAWRPASVVRGGRPGRWSRHRRQLRPGLAALRHRLQLAVLADEGGRTAGGRRHRHALAGPGAARSRAGGRGGLRRPAHRPPGPPAAQGRGGDVHRQARQARCRPSRSTITTEDYGSILLRFRRRAPRGALWVSQVTAGRKNCLRYEIAGSKGALAWNSEVAQRAVDRPPRAGQRVLLTRPGAVRACARRVHQLPRRPQRGLPDTFKQCFRAFYEYIASGRLAVGRQPRLPDVRRRPPRGRALRGDPAQEPLATGGSVGSKPSGTAQVKWPCNSDSSARSCRTCRSRRCSTSPPRRAFSASS